MKPFFLLMLLVSNTLIGQSMVKIFKSYIPEKYLSNEEFVEVAEYNLFNYGKTNPGLIFYYLKSLSPQDTNIANNNRREEYKLLVCLYVKSILEKNNWIEEQIRGVSKHENNRLIRNRLTSKLEALKIDEEVTPLCDEEIDYENNELQFMVFKYLTADETLSYEEQNNYKSINQKTISDYITDLSNVIKSTELISRKREKLDKFLERYSFLLNTKFSSKYSIEQKRTLKELITITTDLHYISKETTGIIIGATYNKINFDNSVNYTFKEKNVPSINFSFLKDFRTETQARIFLGYKFRLKEEKELFSSVEATISFMPLAKAAVEPGFIKQEKIANPYYYGMYNVTSIEDQSSYLLAASLSTPLYFYNEDISFSFGLHYILAKSSYEFTISKEIVQADSYYEGLIREETEKINIGKSSVDICPNFSLNYKFLKTLNISGQVGYNIGSTQLFLAATLSYLIE